MSNRVIELKIWPNFFRDVSSGLKKFEIRADDRGYDVGHILKLREWDPNREIYTGAFVLTPILYRTSIATGLIDGFVVLSLGPLTHGNVAPSLE